LFVSHDASRTGAPIVLLSLLGWLRAHSDLDFEVLLRADGELAHEFAAVAPVSMWNGGDRDLPRRLSEGGGLIYSNTIMNGEVLDAFAPLGLPVISHVHELEYWMRYRVLPRHLRAVQEHTSRYIAVSQAVKQALMAHLDAREDRIDVVHGFVPIQPGREKAEGARRRRDELGIPGDAFVVTGCGTTDWRKGPDVFIQLARVVHREQASRNVHFLWVGGESEGPVWGALRHDVKRTGLEGYVHFIGVRPDPLDYFAASDTFVSVSREDPFPLVMLEAASVGKPIVCFDAAGGAREFVEDDCGFVVPYLDLEAMGSRIAELAHSPETRLRMGRRAVQKVRERHDLAVVAPRILDIIRRSRPMSADTLDVGRGVDRGKRRRRWEVV
jgi:glycosyltransferase involved in cell wall biosynthesis